MNLIINNFFNILDNYQNKKIISYINLHQIGELVLPIWYLI